MSFAKQTLCIDPLQNLTALSFILKTKSFHHAILPLQPNALPFRVSAF